MGNLIFNSKDTKKKFLDIITFCKNNRIDLFFREPHYIYIDLSFNDLSVEDFSNSISFDEDTDLNLSDESLIEIRLPHAFDDDIPIAVSEMWEFINIANYGKIVNNQKFVSAQSSLIYISENIELIELLQTNTLNLNDFSIEQPWNNKQVYVSLVRGFTCYALRLVIEKEYDKYFPPVNNYELFIEITSDENLTEEEVDNISQAYIFECKATLGFNLTPGTRTNEYLGVDIDEFESQAKSIRLRPLISEKGLFEIFKLYNNANRIEDAEFLVLTYVKVLEYISPTVIKKTMMESVSKKLYDPRALHPDSSYILELEGLFNQHRERKKDSESMQLTLEICCDLEAIRKTAPNLLNKIKNFDSFAAMTSNTRNMIAHAKANYQKKGTECPPQHMKEFSDALQVAARQAIYWFAQQHENSRIL